MRRAAKVDGNHAEVVRALRRVGVFVSDCSRAGAGFPDLLCAYRGRLWLLEVKDGSRPPSERKLTPAQVIFHAEVVAKGCEVHVVETVDQAIAVVTRNSS